jgi:hypothetical protein
VFIHGFDNSFEAAITRAAFNREWFVQSGVSGADTTVIVLSLAVTGEIAGSAVAWSDYRRDQTLAGQSGFHSWDYDVSVINAATDTVVLPSQSA